MKGEGPVVTLAARQLPLQHRAHCKTSRFFQKLTDRQVLELVGLVSQQVERTGLAVAPLRSVFVSFIERQP